MLLPGLTLLIISLFMMVSTARRMGHLPDASIRELALQFSITGCLIGVASALGVIFIATHFITSALPPL